MYGNITLYPIKIRSIVNLKAIIQKKRQVLRTLVNPLSYFGDTFAPQKVNSYQIIQPPCAP